MPFVAVFKGPEWQGNFPVMIIQKLKALYSHSLKIDSKVLNQMEKDIRTVLSYQNIKIRKLNSRETLIGNTKAAEIDLIFKYLDQSFHMKSYVLEGSTSYMLSFLALEKDFISSENQAIQSIRSFKE